MTTMTIKNLRNTLLSVLIFLPLIGLAADDQSSASEQIVVPEVSRRDVQLPRFPSNDFEMGVFAGTYSLQNFGSSRVEGIRLGYSLTEDFFVQSVFAETLVQDTTFRQILPGGVFPKSTEKLRYYNIDAGYNLLPGEVFVGTKHAMPFMFYLIGGIGNTTLVDQRHTTLNVGAGMRVFADDSFSIHLDARDHLFSMDLLGARQRTQNLELTIGLLGSF